MQLSVAFSAYCEARYHELQSETYALQRSPRRRRSLTQHSATTGRRSAMNTRLSTKTTEPYSTLRHHRPKRHEHEAVYDSGLDSLFIQLLNFAADKKALQSRNRQLVIFQNARDLRVSLSVNLNPYFSDLWQ
jgi:hypothetical protein